MIPIIGTPKPEGVNCAACHDTRFFYDQDGHGRYSWKRRCHYCTHGAAHGDGLERLVSDAYLAAFDAQMFRDERGRS